MPSDLDWSDRISSSYEVDSVTGCWKWNKGLTQKGYARFQWREHGKMHSKAAHLLVYEVVIGPVPNGLVLDHVCHSKDPSCKGGVTCEHRRCINPAHLEAVTYTLNKQRGAGGFDHTGFCLSGRHRIRGPEDWDGTFSRRTCSECRRERDRDRKRERAFGG